jgi:(p)ppGpp synthase/HD superfamily hydrolase
MNNLVRMHGIKCQNNRKQFGKKEDKKEQAIQISGKESSLKLYRPYRNYLRIRKSDSLKVLAKVCHLILSHTISLLPTSFTALIP